jgi:hypothetical protein
MMSKKMLKKKKKKIHCSAQIQSFWPDNDVSQGKRLFSYSRNRQELLGTKSYFVDAVIDGQLNNFYFKHAVCTTYHRASSNT